MNEPRAAGYESTTPHAVRVQQIISTHMDRAERAADPGVRAVHEHRSEGWLARLSRLSVRVGGEVR